MISNLGSGRSALGTTITLAVSACFIPACVKSNKLSTVQGTVLLRGEPIKGAALTFHPVEDNSVQAARPTGVTSDDGAFRLSCHLGEGAPTGKYVVTITWPEEPKPEAGKKLINTDINAGDARDRLNGRYANRNTSKLQVEITEGVNRLEPFRLE